MPPQYKERIIPPEKKITSYYIDIIIELLNIRVTWGNWYRYCERQKW